MSQVVTISVGRLLGKNERLTTAKFNAVVKSIVINISGSVGTTDLADGAVTPPKLLPGAYTYAPATLAAGTYTAAYAPLPVTTYTDGLWLTFKTDLANTAAPKLDAGAGAKPLVSYGGHPLNAGDIRAGGIATVRYNSTLVVNAVAGAFEVMSLIGPVPLTGNVLGATAVSNGQRGYVPTPLVGEQDYALRGDGTFRNLTPDIDARILVTAPAANNFLQYLHSS